MYGVKKVFIPRHLAEALEILAADETVWPLAGATDVLVKMRHSQMKGVSLLSLTGLGELKGIEELDNGDIAIGAGSTFTDIAECELIKTRVPMLKTAALSMGGPQIQNVATIGGNVCNGATSADSAPSLFALGAVLELVSAKGSRTVPITEFYAGPGKVKREAGELLVRIILPVGGKKNWAGVYIKMSTRKAMDIAILGSAAVCELAGDGKVEKAAIAMGVAGPTPLRFTEAEQLLCGQKLTPALLAQAGKAAVNASNPRTSWRASKEYREALIEELSQRAFKQAFEEAGGKL